MTTCSATQDLLALAATSRRLRDVVLSTDAAWQRRLLCDFALFASGSRLYNQHAAMCRVAKGEPALHLPSPRAVLATAAGPSGSQPAGPGPVRPSLFVDPGHHTPGPSPPGTASGGLPLLPLSPMAALAPSGPTSPAGGSAHGAPWLASGNSFGGGTADSLWRAGSVTSSSPASGAVRPFLPFAGVSTDGGCDSPHADFWVRAPHAMVRAPHAMVRAPHAMRPHATHAAVRARSLLADSRCPPPQVGHLFTPSARTFYSSLATTSNIHALALLQPAGHDDPDDAHRSFLLDRLQVRAPEMCCVCVCV
jgi:hypothetical protein